MLKYISISPVQIIGMLIFVACMLGFIIWATGFRKQNRNIMKYSNVFFTVSAVLIVICLGGLIFKGINWGMDFMGGTLVEIGVSDSVTLPQVREAIDEFAKQSNLQKELDNPKVQMEEGVLDTVSSSSPAEGSKNEKVPVQSDTTMRKCLIQTRELTSDQVTQMTAFLGSKLGKVETLKQETIGPTIGKELQGKALLALIIALVAQLIYITIRFGTQFRYGVAADIALLHDIIVMVGLYSLFGKPVDSTFLAALLTIVGYSVMDSVVVFDRIRENLDLMKGMSYMDTVNLSLNQTITRTSLTSATTIMTIFALFYFGGSTLHNFALALLIGSVAGTYSSLFIASPLLILFDNMAKGNEKKRVDARRKKLQEQAEEKARKKSAGKQKTRDEKIAPENYPSPGEMGQDKEE